MTNQPTNHIMKITIQLRPERFQGQGDYIGRRTFSERVLPQDFTSDIYTDGDSYRNEVGIFSRSQPSLGGFAKTELGMKRAINKLIKDIAEV